MAPAASAAIDAASAPTCPEDTCTDVATPRCVTGMPASAGTLNAEVMPGTTDTSTPARRHACTSSPPRPKTYGSPPLKRTTVSPCRARSTRIALISVLRHRVVGRALADVDDLDVGRQPVEQRRWHRAGR